MGALATAVQSGRALYAGISQYEPEATEEATAILRQMGCGCSSISRTTRSSTAGSPAACSTLDRDGLGCIAFSPLAQGMLTSRYLNGIPEGSSRPARPSRHA
jgi:L-glyceraldehyde 3-phosphate reductase